MRVFLFCPSRKTAPRERADPEVQKAGPKTGREHREKADPEERNPHGIDGSASEKGSRGKRADECPHQGLRPSDGGNTPGSDGVFAALEGGCELAYFFGDGALF